MTVVALLVMDIVLLVVLASMCCALLVGAGVGVTDVELKPVSNSILQKPKTIWLFH